MGNGQRVQMAKEAALKVIDTLSWTDYAAVVTFGTVATPSHATLQKMEDDNKAALKNWVGSNVHSNGGGTNFGTPSATLFS